MRRQTNSTDAHKTNHKSFIISQISESVMQYNMVINVK